MKSFHSLPILCGLLALAIAAAAVSRGDEVYLKDGTILRGQVVTQMDYINDPLGESFLVMKAGGFFAVADGVRIVIFSSKQVDPTQGDAGSIKNVFLDQFLRFQQDVASRGGQPPGGTFMGAGPFNNRGVRKLKMRDALNRPYEIDQAAQVVTPFGVQLKAKNFNWKSLFLTNEFDRKVIRDLIYTFPEMTGTPTATKRLKVFRFFLQAKWFPEAEKELDTAIKLFPANQEIASARTALEHARAEDTLEQVRRALLAGQFRYAQALMARVPNAGLPGGLMVKANTLRVHVQNQTKQWEMAIRFLHTLPDEVDGPDSELLCDAAESIRDNLYLEAIDRLEPFIVLAEQAERQRKAGGQPNKSAEELLALAVTGWLLGKESAQAKPEAARKLWKARRFVERYVASDELGERGILMTRYKSDEPVEIEELARLISLLPPAKPDDSTGLKLIKRRAAGPRETDYWVQLPLDYFPGRPYPVVIVLNSENQRPQDIIEWYRQEAVMNGFILVAADWSGGTFGPYVYSAAEHERVLEVLHDLKLRFPVDPDRVFLTGWGHGANATWDIGLSHPDLFAGIAPISGDPDLSKTLALYRNAQNLPMYIVTGDAAGDAPKKIQRVVTEMINRGFPILHSVYRGRGIEWFGGELPYIFEWMTKKRRYSGHTEVGRFPGGAFGNDHEEYQSMRSTDNRFWWLSSSDIMDRYLIENKPQAKSFNPARFQGTIKPDNEIVLYSLGLRNLTLRLGPGMIDYSKPVRIKWPSYRQSYVWTNGKAPLKPSVETMLEELRKDRDRQRLVYVKVTLP